MAGWGLGPALGLAPMQMHLMLPMTCSRAYCVLKRLNLGFILGFVSPKPNGGTRHGRFAVHVQQGWQKLKTVAAVGLHKI